MTRDDIIRMAREANFYESEIGGNEDGFVHFAHIVYESVFRDANIAASRTILDAAVLAEREACAKVCEEFYSIEGIAQECAAAIRAMSEV